jgi:hypothetical protein
MMSQRAQSASIMQLKFPDGATKPVNSYTSRSAGAGPVIFSGARRRLSRRPTGG